MQADSLEPGIPNANPTDIPGRGQNIYHDPRPSIPSPSHATTYDPRKLSLAQAKMVAGLLGNLTSREAAAEAGISPATHRKWLQTDSNYRAAVKELGVELLDSARATLDLLLPEAADAYAEGLGANEPMEIWVDCPDCGSHFKATSLAPDLKTRISVADRIFKRSGDMAAQVKVSGEVKHRDMVVEDKLALAQVSAWQESGSVGPCPVPPDVYQSLQMRGLLTDPSQAGEVVDSPGFREIRQLAPRSLADYADSEHRDTQPGEYRETD